jgi:hypothetical protein
MTDAARLRRRLPAWIAFAVVFASLGYAANVAGDPAEDVLYLWSTAIGGAVQYAIIAGVMLAIAWQLPAVTLGFRRPASWRTAAALVGGGLVAIWIVAASLAPFLDAGEEQGLVPDEWDGSRWAPFAANFVLVAVVAPVVEELVYRGVGFSLVAAVGGERVAIAVTALAFGTAHGLVVALPVLTAFGVILGVVRLRTGSVYPPMILHGLFNGISLLAAVAYGAGT